MITKLIFKTNISLRNQVDNLIETKCLLSSGYFFLGDNKVEIHENDDASMETESINDGMPSVILEAIKAHKLLEKILNKALFLPAENVQEILKSPEGRKNDGKMVMQMVTTLQTKVIY